VSTIYTSHGSSSSDCASFWHRWSRFRRWISGFPTHLHNLRKRYIVVSTAIGAYLILCRKALVFVTHILHGGRDGSGVGNTGCERVLCRRADLFVRQSIRSGCNGRRQHRRILIRRRRMGIHIVHGIGHGYSSSGLGRWSSFPMSEPEKYHRCHHYDSCGKPTDCRTNGGSSLVGSAQDSVLQVCRRSCGCPARPPSWEEASDDGITSTAIGTAAGPRAGSLDETTGSTERIAATGMGITGSWIENHIGRTRLGRKLRSWDFGTGLLWTNCKITLC
jgi:hypothetical protein